jgi:hypothetical protein
MPVHITWDEGLSDVIRYDFEGRWTWNEFEQAYSEAVRLFGTVDHPVDVIVNLLPSTALPRGILDVVKRVADNAPPHHGMTVYVGQRDILQVFARAFERIYPNAAARYPLAFCATLDEARARLKAGSPPLDSEQRLL